MKKLFIIFFLLIPFLTNGQNINKIRRQKRKVFITMQCNNTGCRFKRYRVMKQNKKTMRRNNEYMLSQCKGLKKKRRRH